MVGKFRAQVAIDVANFAETENGHKPGPQGTDPSLDPTFGDDFSRRVRFRPPRGRGGPTRPDNFKILEIFKKLQGDYNLRQIYEFTYIS